MTPETVNAWFTPFHYFVYLGVLFVGMVVYYQWTWSQTCKNNIQVLVAQQSGGGEYVLAPKDGGSVSITNPQTGSVRTWPVNELATIDVLYPGVGFVPAFLQKTIRLAIVNEGDWEPMLNRSAHTRKVASPDMVEALEAIAEAAAPTTKAAIKHILDGVSTAPTREMIASPAVLGNLMQEKISELAVTVAKDIVNPLNEAIKKLGQRLNSTVVYVGLGLVALIAVVTLYQVMQIANMDVITIAEDIGSIKQALGVK